MTETATPRSTEDLADESDLIIDSKLRQTFRALSASGIRWCLLRGEDRLNVPGEDVDLLIAAGDAERASAVLASCSFLPMPDWNHPTHTHYVAYDADADRWIKLDVVHDLAYGPAFDVRTDAAGEVLNRRDWKNELALPSPDDAFWTLLWHCLLDKGTLPPHHADRLKQLVREADVENQLARTLAGRLPSSWSLNAVIDHVKRGDRAPLEELAQQLRSRVRRPARRRVLAPVSRLLRRTRFRASRPGVIVALLAPDGAGKSTVANGIGESFPFPVHIAWFGQSPRPIRPVSILGASIPGTVLIKQLFKIWASYLPGAWHRMQGRLVIFDRYVYDRLFVLDQNISMRERIYFTLTTSAVPRPDLVVVLDVPGDVMFKRKGEHSPEELETQRERFRSIARALSSGVVVDATHDADTVRRTVTGLIWRRYIERWTGTRGSVHGIDDLSVTTH